ncbi:hypothetical protein [Kitasatospora sp. NPDC093102]|uniref:hypothetical protein n=1 Tax=Kitasatospora sp. NPDC093102 TaxID=3155069 RepID=UPI00341D7976
MRGAGRALPVAERRRHDTTIRTILGDDRQPSGPDRDHDVLAAVLAEAEQAGHDPRALLEEATFWRELGTARNRDDVLVWRIRRIADLPVNPALSHTTPTTIAWTSPKPRRTTPRTAPPGSAQPTTGQRRPSSRR